MFGVLPIAIFQACRLRWSERVGTGVIGGMAAATVGHFFVPVFFLGATVKLSDGKKNRTATIRHCHSTSAGYAEDPI